MSQANYEQEKLAFIERHRHELAGYVCEAVTTGKAGAPLAAWLRQTMQRIDQRLALMYQELRPDTAVPKNVTKTPAQPTTQQQKAS